ncbi:MAG: M48 family metallopeptidase [Cytophagaceae bacterium]|nr:M48 family metallopeptidase [Gemmatimonadaceae bacterium]
MAAPTDLFSQQARNRSRSRWVVVPFIAFFAWLGFGGDWIAWQYTRYAPAGEYHHAVPWLGIVLTLLGAGMATYAWKTGPQRVLWSTSAREITTPETPEERTFVNVVEEMAVASGVPRPRTWIVPDADPNAFATGRDEQTAHIAVTQGLLETLNRDELQAVIGHEMGHVRNLDVRLMTLLAALVGAITLLGDGMWRMMRGGARLSGGGSSNGGKKKGGNPLLLVALVLWIISWLLAPIIIRLLAMSVSREREYLADAMSAQFTRNPLALASALGRIEGAVGPTTAIKRGSAHLCIADPLGRDARALGGWGASHPPMAIRIARLKAMAHGRDVTVGG